MKRLAVACLFTFACATSKPAPPQPPAAPAAVKPHDLPAPADVAAPPADAERTASGLATKVLKQGEGKVHPTATDRAYARYSAWTTDGKMFLSNEGDFNLADLLPGWTEGMQLMVVGEKRRMWIPEALGYNGLRDPARRAGGPAGMVVFDVELLEINPIQYEQVNSTSG